MAGQTGIIDGEAAERALLYQVVVQALRAEILRGTYPVGTTLPSEAALVRRFNVSRHTVRQALRSLRELGLVQSHQGLGTIVVQPGGSEVYVHQVNSIGDLHDFAVMSRYDDHAQPLVADRPLAERLRVATGETWLLIHGTRHLDLSEPPVCAVEIYVHRDFAAVSRLLHRRTGPIYALIEDNYGESIAMVEQELRAIPLPLRVAQILGLDAGTTGVEIRRVYRLNDNRPAEITFNYYNATQFSLSMNLRRVRD